MTVLLIILGCILSYLMVGLFLAKTNRKKLAAMHTRHQMVKHIDEEYYNEKVVESSFTEAVYLMVFGWPIYFFIHQSQRIANQTYKEVDPETQVGELRWMKSQMVKAKNDAEILQRELLKQLESQKSAEVRPKKDSENHLTLDEVVRPKAPEYIQVRKADGVISWRRSEYNPHRK